MKRNLSGRKYVIIAIFILVAIIFIVRLLFLQVIDDSYLLSAENNVLRKNTIYPNRGLIYDKKGQLLVYDEAAYDLMVIPRKVKSIDTVEFCDMLGITDSTFRIKMASRTSRRSHQLAHHLYHRRPRRVIRHQIINHRINLLKREIDMLGRFVAWIH